MYVLQRGVNGTLGTVYCVGFVVLGPFCVLNLFLAMLFDSYGRQLPKSRRQELRGEMRGAAAHAGASPTPPPSPPPSPPVYGGGMPAWRLGGGGGCWRRACPSGSTSRRPRRRRAPAQLSRRRHRRRRRRRAACSAASRIRYHRGAAAVGGQVGVSLEANDPAAGGGEQRYGRLPPSAPPPPGSSPVRVRLRERAFRAAEPHHRTGVAPGRRRRRAAEAAAVAALPRGARVGDARLGCVGVGARRRLLQARSAREA